MIDHNPFKKGLWLHFTLNVNHVLEGLTQLVPCRVQKLKYFDFLNKMIIRKQSRKCDMICQFSFIEKRWTKQNIPSFILLLYSNNVLSCSFWFEGGIIGYSENHCNSFILIEDDSFVVTFLRSFSIL